MRVVMAALALAVVAPTGGMKSCASGTAEAPTPSAARVRVLAGESPADGLVPLDVSVEEIRVGCFAPEVADEVDPVADTAPLPDDLRVSYPEPCEFFAFRRVGGLWDRSTRSWYRPGDAQLSPILYPYGGAGVGIAFRHDPWRRDVVITGVASGAPADGVLARGDRVLEVDGAPAGKARWTFADQVMGVAGTTVDLTVLRAEGGVEHVVLPRVFLGP